MRKTKKPIDKNNPPPICPRCFGEREWSGKGNQAICYFCQLADTLYKKASTYKE